MLAIDEIAVVAPRTSASLVNDYQQLGLDAHQARVYSRLYGFSEVPLARPGEEITLLESAVDQLLATADVDPARVSLLVHAHTGPYIGPVGLSLPRRFARRLGGQVLAFGMQLHKCVSSITALDTIERLLAQRPSGTVAVLLVGESADSPDLRVLETAVVGDIGCAVLLSSDGARDRLIARTVTVHGQYSGGVYADPRAPSRREYEENFQVNLCQVIVDTLSRAGVTVEQLRYVLPHNVNVHVWKKAADLLGIGQDRLYLDNVPRFAHCFGADMFVNFADVRASLRPGDHCLMASVGVGGAFGAVVLRH